MGFWKWRDKMVKKIDGNDISLIKLSSAAFILMVAKLWTPILSLAWYWYLLIAIAAAIRPLNKALKK